MRACALNTPWSRLVPSDAGTLQQATGAQFGTIFHTDAERTRFARLLASGWVDLFRAANPEAREFTWWDYRAGAFHKGQGLRIDFLLGTPALAARVRSVSIDREWRKKQEGLVASDHAPVIAELA